MNQVSTSISDNKIRVNLSLSQEDKEILDMLAHRDAVTPTTKAVSMLRDALEREEDVTLEKLALERMSDNVEYIPHDKFWEQAMEDRVSSKD